MTKKYSYEEVRSIIEDDVGYKLVSKEYKSSDKKLDTRCPKGHLYKTSLYNLMSGKRCGRCRGSKGENLVYYILEELLPEDIIIQPQRTEVIDGVTCRYDFYIPLAEGLYIEYDGYQHFYELKDSPFKQSLKEVQKLDSMKNKFVHEKGSKLLRIHHTTAETTVLSLIYDFLEGKAELKKTPKDFTKQELVKEKSSDLLIKKYEKIAKFYLSNSLDDTKKKFELDGSTISTAFICTYGMNKTKMSRLSFVEIANHYLNNEIKVTADKFNIYQEDVPVIFNNYFCMTKREYKNQQRKASIANDYLTNSSIIVGEKYGCSKEEVCNIFKQVFNKSKRVYIRTTNNESAPKQTNIMREVSDRYLNETAEETANFFNISVYTVKRYFKETYGEPKEDYLGIRVTDQQIASHYLGHTQSETAKKYGRSMSNVSNIFLKLYGVDKRQYLLDRKGKPEDIAKFRIDHTIPETSERFGVSEIYIDKCFRETYGMNRTNYLKKLQS